MTSSRQTANSNSSNSGSNWQDRRGTSSERGYGAAWQKLREIAMQRDMWLCQPCLSRGKATPANECDHIMPKAKGGTDDLDNLQAICTDCHKAKTTAEAAEAQGRSVKQRLRFDAAGFPIWPD